MLVYKYLEPIFKDCRKIFRKYLSAHEKNACRLCAVEYWRCRLYAYRRGAPVHVCRQRSGHSPQIDLYLSRAHNSSNNTQIQQRAEHRSHKPPIHCRHAAKSAWEAAIFPASATSWFIFFMSNFPWKTCFAPRGSTMMHNALTCQCAGAARRTTLFGHYREILAQIS